MLRLCCPSSAPVSLNTLIRSLSGKKDLRTDAATYFETDPEKFATKLLIDIVLGFASGSLYSMYLIGKGIYDICTVEGKMQVKGASVSDLIHKIKSRGPGATEIHFIFDHQSYKLKEVYNESHVLLGMILCIDGDAKEGQDLHVHSFHGLSLAMLEQRIPQGEIEELNVGPYDVEIKFNNDERSVVPAAVSDQLEQRVFHGQLEELKVGPYDVEIEVGNDEVSIVPVIKCPLDPVMVSNKMVCDTVIAIASGDLHRMLVGAKNVCELWTNEEKNVVKGNPINYIIHALKSMKQGSQEIRFLFNNTAYRLSGMRGNGLSLLIESDDCEGNDALVQFFPDLSLNDLAQALPENVCFSATQQLRSELCGRLDKSTKAVFQNLLYPLEVQCHWGNPSLTVGNQNGSTPRLILGAMMAGYIDLDPKGLDMLANAMKREAELLIRKAERADEEDSEETEPFLKKNSTQLTDEILDHMIFRSGYTLFINMISGENNRYTTDQHLDDLITKQLMAAGAKFISNNPKHKTQDGYCRAFWDPLTFQFYIPDGLELINISKLALTLEQWEQITQDNKQDLYRISPYKLRTVMTKHGAVQPKKIDRMVRDINAGQLPAQPDDFHPTRNEIIDAIHFLGDLYFKGIRLTTSSFLEYFIGPQWLNLNSKRDWPMAAYTRSPLDENEMHSYNRHGYRCPKLAYD